MELTGRIIAVMPAQSGVSARTGNNWMSQEYVIEVPGQYPRKCVFRLFGEDRIKQFNIQQGEDLTIQFDMPVSRCQALQWQLPVCLRPRRSHRLMVPQRRSRQLRNPQPKVQPTICLSKRCPLGDPTNKSNKKPLWSPNSTEVFVHRSDFLQHHGGPLGIAGSPSIA